MPLKKQHILTGTELSVGEIKHLITLACDLKKQRGHTSPLLAKKSLALLFDKPSLRTRFSFAIAMQELGGHVIESVGQNRKKETPEDTMRVLQGYCHGIMIRTYEDASLERMANVATIPIINGLSDLHHPCQILADLMTLTECFQDLNGLTLCYLGDGNNILHSLLLLAPQLGVHIHYCCPPGSSPNSIILQMAQEKTHPGTIKSFDDPKQAVANVDAVYTDVWTSMGFSEKDQSQFQGFQVNQALMAKAKPNALFMHCMPINRGQEVSETLPDEPYSVIFQQSENRLHIQKALLVSLLGDDHG